MLSIRTGIPIHTKRRNPPKARKGIETQLLADW